MNSSSPTRFFRRDCPQYNRSFGLAACLGLIAAALPLESPAAGVPFGAIGDSLVDEHIDQNGFGVNLGYSKNWYELLVDAMEIDGGNLAAPADWGDMRKGGYEYNWALAGATTADMIADGQHVALAAQAPGKGIDRAVIVIGANDFLPVPPTGNPLAPGSNYEAIYEGLATPAEIQLGISNGLAAARTAVEALQATGIRVVGATVPDYGIATYTKTFYPDAAKRELVTDVIRQVNQARVVDLANDLGVPLVDLFALTKQVWGENASPNATFELGGVQFNLAGTGGVDYLDVLAGNPIAPTSDTIDAFVHDGIHPNSVVGGVFANLFATAFNEGYGDSFDTFTEQQILANGGPNLAAMYTDENYRIVPIAYSDSGSSINGASTT